MKQFKLFTAVVASSLVLLTSCEKEMDSVVNLDSGTQLSASKQQLAKLPAGLDGKLQHDPGRLPITHQEYRDMVRRALAIEADPTCDDNTEMNQWLDKQLDDWFDENGKLDPAIATALDLAVLDLPTYNALYFENSSKNQYYGANGEYTKQLTKAFKDLQRFWDIPSEDIVLAAMHGSMLLDREKVIRTYVEIYGLPTQFAVAYADYIVAVANELPQFRKGNHPIFTFNAFALDGGFEFEPYGIIPDKIVMGDGIMDAFAAIGFGDVAPQAILAHEFAHQIQFELGLFEDVDSPEATRRTELMADAYAAYYLSHARGATMQWKRVQQFLQVFFNIGDCSFDSNGHHGTPEQRIAAAMWGYQLADNAQKQGHILSAQEFAERFEAQLPQLVML